MPNDATNVALINAGATMASGATQAIAQSNINKRTRAWNEKMYGLQREHALADWNMQNEYNDPSAVMARLRKAGLNPNLVYGNGAATPTDTVRSSSSPAWNPQAPDMSFIGHAAGNALSAYQNWEMKEAQTNNLRAQNTVLLEEAALKAATTKNLEQRTDTGVFDLGMKNILAETNYETKKTELERLKTQIGISLDENERRAALTAQSLTKGVQEVINMKAAKELSEQQRLKLKKEMEILKWDEKLKAIEHRIKAATGISGGGVVAGVIGKIATEAIESIKTEGTILNSAAKDIFGSELKLFPTLGGWRNKDSTNQKK